MATRKPKVSKGVKRTQIGAGTPKKKMTPAIETRAKTPKAPRKSPFI